MVSNSLFSRLIQMLSSFFITEKSDSNKYPSLSVFIVYWFGQDFDCNDAYNDADNDNEFYENVVNAVFKRENETSIRNLLMQINAIMSDGKEFTKSRLENLGFSFVPEDEDEPAVEFLSHIRDLITSKLEKNVTNIK